MLTPRNSIIAALVLLTLWVGFSIRDAISPFDSAGRGRDTYGLRNQGQRAIYETLKDIGIPVERRLNPPDTSLDTNTTLVMLEPDPLLAGYEPEPLRATLNWVRSGGRLVLVPPAIDFSTQQQAEQLEHFEADLLKSLGITGIRVEPIVTWNLPQDTLQNRSDLLRLTVIEPDEFKTLAASNDGLSGLSYDDSSNANVHTAILDADGDQRTLAVRIPLDEGELILLSDAGLLSNVALAYEENAVWGVDLLSDSGRRSVIFDEFYHGQSVRGNNFWLLTQPRFLFVFLAILLLLAIRVWRDAVLLGPPVITLEPSRRSISEYVNAMGRLLLRSRHTNSFLLKQVRDGVWRALCGETHLPVRTSSIDTLVVGIARHDLPRAELVRNAMTHADLLLKQARTDRKFMFTAIRDLHGCLKPIVGIDATRR